MMLPQELESVAFIRNLGGAHLKKVAELAQLKEYEERCVLFEEGEQSPFIYLVLSGRVNLAVALPDTGPVEVYSAGPGELVGWSPVLGARATTATARAASRCRVAALPAAQVLQLCEADPRFGVAFLRQVNLVLCERLSHTRHRLAQPARSRGPLSMSLESY